MLEHKLEKLKTGNQKSIKTKDQLWENQQKCSVLVNAKEKANQRTNCWPQKWKRAHRNSVHIKWRRILWNVFIHKFDHPDKMIQFFEKQKLPKFTESD